jgi:hypothetical protein
MNAGQKGSSVGFSYIHSNDKTQLKKKKLNTQQRKANRGKPSALAKPVSPSRNVKTFFGDFNSQPKMERQVSSWMRSAASGPVVNASVSASLPPQARKPQQPPEAEVNYHANQQTCSHVVLRPIKDGALGGEESEVGSWKTGQMVPSQEKFQWDFKGLETTV